MKHEARHGMFRSGPFPGITALAPGAFSAQALVSPFVPIGPGSSRWMPLRSGEAPPLPRFDPAAPTLGRIGSLEVRLARSVGEVKKAQTLRYHVFYEEMSAVADALTLASGRDRDAFDALCDHMLVLDHDVPARPFRKPKPKIVGCYRLLRRDVAERHLGFYSAGEFDLQPMLDRHPEARMLELGRSCVLKPYRNKRTVELLWHGVWSYILSHRIDAMFGCASLEGTDPDRLALPLSFLAQNARAPEDWRVRAQPGRGVAMNRLPPDQVDLKAALHALPPLLKGYLRLGATFGDEAVVDHQFGTTDVLVIMPVASLSSRYVNYYGADASRHAG